MKKTNGSIVGSAKKHLLSRKWAIPALIFALVALVTLTVFIVVINPAEDTEEKLVCTPGSTVHAKLVSAILKTETQAAKKYADQIKADPGYKNDINCLNGLIQYSLFVSSSRKAEEYLVPLSEIVKNDDTTLDEAYAKVGARTVKDVKAQVAEVVKARGEGNAGVLTF